MIPPETCQEVANFPASDASSLSDSWGAVQADDVGKHGEATEPEPEAEPERDLAVSERAAPDTNDELPDGEGDDHHEPLPEQEPTAPERVAPHTQDGAAPEEQKTNAEDDKPDDDNHTEEVRIRDVCEAPTDCSQVRCYAIM